MIHGLESQIEEIERLGAQLEARRARVLQQMIGKIATYKDQRFKIDGAKIYQGGTATRLFIQGAKLKKNGEPHATARFSLPIQTIEIEDGQ